MPDPGCRIGRVRNKETGGEVYILPDLRVGRDEEAKQWFIESMDHLDEFSEGQQIVGVALVAVTDQYEVFTAFESEAGELYKLSGASNMLNQRITMKVLGTQTVAEALGELDG